jgi:DNA-binding XRE family transcriptional regulator
MKLICKLRDIRVIEYRIDSKREFAEILGVEEHTYANWEKGKTYPDIARAYDIAAKLNRSIYDIWHPEG